MSAAPPNLAVFHEKLETAIKDGQIGRRELIDEVAAMPIEQIGALPPAAMEMLGSTGLAQIARRRIATDPELKDLRLKPQEPISEELETSQNECRHPMVRACLAACMIMVLGLLVDILQPFVAARLDEGVRPIASTSWPKCARLDRHVDGCLYSTGSRDLTLEEAAAFLRMPANELAVVNPHLPSSLTARLPADSPIVVWRGTMTLKGSTR